MSLQIRRSTYRGREGFSMGRRFFRSAATARAYRTCLRRQGQAPVHRYWGHSEFWDKVATGLLLAERQS